VSAISFPETCPLNFPIKSPMYAPCDKFGFSFIIFCASDFRSMFDFFVASFSVIPWDIFCITVFASVSGISSFDIFSRIDSRLSIEISGLGWKMVNILAIRFGLLYS